MIIALLVLLGINLVVVVALLGLVLGRRRWVTRQPDVFRGVARGVSGEVHGFRPRWRRGYGRWVRGVLVWTKGPFFFWNEIVPVDTMAEERPAEPGEVSRLGDEAVVVRLTSDGATVEVAVRGEDRTLLVGPYDGPVDTTTVPASPGS
jgi:hypothetical protein